MNDLTVGVICGKVEEFQKGTKPETFLELMEKLVRFGLVNLANIGRRLALANTVDVKGVVARFYDRYSETKIETTNDGDSCFFCAYIPYREPGKTTPPSFRFVFGNGFRFNFHLEFWSNDQSYRVFVDDGNVKLSNLSEDDDVFVQVEALAKKILDMMRPQV